VVNEAFARQYLADQNPIGATVRIFNVDWRIVGLCHDTKYDKLKAESPATVYCSFRQYPMNRSVAFTVRTSLEPLAVVADVRKAVAALDPAVAVSHLATEDALRDANVSQERLLAMLCGGLAALALLLACIGLYGLMAYHVARRTSEIAIRLAIGAQAGDVAGAIVREALTLAGLGIAAGLPCAFAVAQLIKSQLYGVQPTDPATLAAVILALIVVTLAAAWLPARRATSVNPMVALRSE